MFVMIIDNSRISSCSTNVGRPSTVGEERNISLVTPFVLPILSMYALAEAQQNALAASSEVAEQGLSLIHMVRAHGSESVEAARYRSKLWQLLGLQTRQGLLYGASRVADGGLNAVLLATVMPLSLL